MQMNRIERVEYLKAIQDVLFGNHCLPYMPTEPPASLSEEIMESDPLYACKQCKDCFRFQSSLEDHNTRHSWILGFWCHICFETVCTHIIKTGSACIKCSACTKNDNDKHIYLLSKGLLRNRKMGVIKVFYNRCQFIEHMKMHQLITVNMNDLMLMPLPINMNNNDWSSELEILCEALMERPFLSRIHIADWLKLYNLQDNWWKLVNGKSDNDMINEIVESYQGYRQLFETYKSTANMNFNIEPTNDSSMDKNINNNSSNIISDKNVLENEDNPCISTDITFVDCGPTSQYFEPEIPDNYTYNKQVTTQVRQVENRHLANTARMNNKTKDEAFKDNNLHKTDITHENTITGSIDSNESFVIKQSSRNYVQYKTIKPFLKKTVKNNPSKTDVSKISNNSTKIGIQFPAKKSATTKTNLDHLKQSLQTSKVNVNSKITIQNSKDIASIISQLPSHLIFKKKIIVIGQDSYKIVIPNENEMITKNDSSISITNNSGTDSNMSIQKICDSNFKKQEFDGKILIKNGKKYLIHTKNITKDPRTSNLSIVRNITETIKQPTSEHNTSKSKLTSTNSNKFENVDLDQTASLHSNSFLLTSSSSLSELSNSSSYELHDKMPQLQMIPSYSISPVPKYSFETISLIEKENGHLYMDIKGGYHIIKNLRNMTDVIVKYRREMIDEFYQMNSLELKERIHHLQYLSKEIKRVFNFVSHAVFTEKLGFIDNIQCILQECLQTKDDQDIQDTKNNDVVLNEWETKIDPACKCLSCNKLKKPKSYIVGFSKLSQNDNVYCSCYKQVCHVCLSFEGSTEYRFIAHQNLHKKREPYICPDCCSTFNSATSLEVHIWTVCFHVLKKIIFTCRICQIDGFRDIESITRHFVIMHSKTKVGCEDCFRVFFSYKEYVEHCTETHPSKMERNPIRLVICKLNNVILRCENYMSYLEQYTGIRKLTWYKCPFCHLITIKNKHVTKLLNTHLRNNHVETLSKILSKEAFIEIFGTKFLKDRKSILQDVFSKNNDPLANKVLYTEGWRYSGDATVPRIVSTRTISSEIFEHGSQDMEYTWSTDTNVVNENPQIMKKIDNEKNRELLPKIINVRSIGNFQSFKSKDAKFSPKTKESNSSFQVIVETKGRKVDPFVHEETAMELDDNKSMNNEGTAKVKEPNKDNNELTINALCVSESKKPLVDTDDTHVNSLPIVSSNKEMLNSTSGGSTDSRIKIVDFRKICKPDVEQFVTMEVSNVQIKDENVSYRASMPKPPLLTRIPQHLLESVEVNESNDEPANDSIKSKSNKSLIQRVTDKSKMHIALGMDTKKEESIDYLCHLCNERINTFHFVIQAHFREKHSDEYTVATITPQLSRMSSDFINGGYKQFINSKKRKSNGASFSSKRKRRWTPKKQVEMKDANPLVGLCVEQETAEDDEGNFICKKCKQRYTNMSDLREHIAANHRLNGRYLICLECGDNYVVASSLQMHLKVFHGIEDPINYMNQNPSHAPDNDLQMGERTTMANQCHVCMAVFKDKAAVDKHLRVHGMAFLNRKRIEARNALEKKTSTEEDKPSVIRNEAKEAVKQDKPVEIILEKINAAI